MSVIIKSLIFLIDNDTEPKAKYKNNNYYADDNIDTDLLYFFFSFLLHDIMLAYIVR